MIQDTKSTRFLPLKNVVGAVVDFFFPACCPLCDALLVKATPFCDTCQGVLPALPDAHCCVCAEPFARTQGIESRCQVCLEDPPAFERVFAAGLHQGLLQKAIHQFKYGGKVRLDRPLAEFLADAVPPAVLAEIDGLIPVPLEPGRWRQRMYNQAALLCRWLTRFWDVPCIEALERQSGGLPQQGLTRRERRDNLRGQIRPIADVRGRTLLLVDDVSTTGSTLRECARVLHRAGAERIYGLVLARADRHAFLLTAEEVR